jgi:short-subunit dehydrogenase
MKLDGKKIVITGAASGIGKAILNELKKFNVTITAADLEPEKIETVPGKISSVKCDVSAPENIDKLLNAAVKNMGCVDIFIANAGFAYFEQIDKADWNRAEKIYKVNFLSPVYTIQKMRELNKNREYMVMVTASAMAKLALPGYALYSSTKAALDSFTTAYRYEQEDRGIISVLYPIATKTDFFKAAADDTTPVPFPAQTPESVAKAAVRGIKRNRKSIYPSKLFYLMMIFNRYLPVVFYVYVKIEKMKFFRWLKSGK